MTLEDVLRAPLPTRIEGVVERMGAIEEALSAHDGARVHAALPRGVVLVQVHGSPQHADFRAIDPLLAETETRVRRDFATGLVGWADEALGERDSVVAMWKVSRARGAAWVR
jgi:hypothetical protein